MPELRWRAIVQEGIGARVGGKPRLGKTSKMGQRDIRRLLIIGAIAVVRRAVRKGAPEGSWLARLDGSSLPCAISHFPLQNSLDALNGKARLGVLSP